MVKKCNCKLVPVQATKAYRGSRSTAPLILNLSNGWDRAVNFTHNPPGLSKPERGSWYSLNGELGEQQNRSGRLGKGKNLFSLPGLKLRIFQPVA